MSPDDETKVMFTEKLAYDVPSECVRNATIILSPTSDILQAEINSIDSKILKYYHNADISH